jgi:hypothetical protein
VYLGNQGVIGNIMLPWYYNKTGGLMIKLKPGIYLETMEEMLAHEEEKDCLEGQDIENYFPDIDYRAWSERIRFCGRCRIFFKGFSIMGRKKIDIDKKRKNYMICMSPDEHELLARLGLGSVAKGLRKVLEFYLVSRETIKRMKKWNALVVKNIFLSQKELKFFSFQI